jgi:hypothetical protein
MSAAGGPAASAVRWPPAWVALLVVPGPLLAWHDALERALAAHPATPLAPPALSPWAGVAVVAAGVLAETCAYGMLWAACGHRLRFAWAALAVLQLSMLDLLAASLTASTAVHAGAWWRVLLLGARGAPGAAHGGFGAAFAGAGLLTGSRLVLAGCLQADCAGAHRREGIAMVGAAWLVTHGVQACVLDLLWGRSVHG